MKFSEKVRMLRKEAHLSQSQLAAAIGVSGRTVQSYVEACCAVWGPAGLFAVGIGRYWRVFKWSANRQLFRNEYANAD